MRVVLSECMPDYVSYTFPYHVWGFLEEGETPATALALGFLPLTFDLSRFYLSRSIRVQLSDFGPNKRIRYAQRQCEHISSRLLARTDFEFTKAWQDLATAYFATRADAVEYRQRRFLEMLDSPFTTHVMLWTDDVSGAPVGLAPLYLESQVGEYGISIYAPDYTAVNIGNHMLAEILKKLQDLDCTHAYVGTCYSDEALYKTRVPGMQFFNGFRWSDDRAELHHFIDRQQRTEQEHILSTEAYAKAFGGPSDPPTLWRLQASG
ncbi:hypothetical protein GCM10009745_43290 [Kribbella yunnanensis]|uniref:GNAT family N-acetyltransferase n=1 Tax=Kribbella yunnanensis TaxID=190194 RepID=A0ABN2HTY7_9ACTN